VLLHFEIRIFSFSRFGFFKFNASSAFELDITLLLYLSADLANMYIEETFIRLGGFFIARGCAHFMCDDNIYLMFESFEKLRK
jgi:hypothetical protein